MALIHIINGTYGHRPVLPNGKRSHYVVPTTRQDPPIEVDDEKARELVEGGIAEYVEAVQETKAEPEKAPETKKPETKKPETKPQTKGTAKKSTPAKGKAEDKAPVLTAEEVVD